MIERLLISLVVVTLCLGALGDMLPRLAPWLALLAGVGVALRVVWHFTRWH